MRVYTFRTLLELCQNYRQRQGRRQVEHLRDHRQGKASGRGAQRAEDRGLRERAVQKRPVLAAARRGRDQVPQGRDQVAVTGAATECSLGTGFIRETIRVSTTSRRPSRTSRGSTRTTPDGFSSSREARERLGAAARILFPPSNWHRDQRGP